MKRFEPRNLRCTILRMAKAGSSVHIACAFSIVEVLAVLIATICVRVQAARRARDGITSS